MGASTDQPHSSPMAGTESVAKTVRRQAREEIRSRIIEAAKARLVEDGAAGLSLRAVARDVGMASSAVYRYIPSRHDLLTELIVESYDELGQAAEDAEAQIARHDLAGRWLAICHAVRDWAMANPNEYALIYGSPVPGYVAPEDTVGPATRVTSLLRALLIDRISAAGGQVQAPSDNHDTLLRRSLAPVRLFIPDEVPDDLVIGGLMAWTHLFGAISFELFGHHHRVIADEPELRRLFFDEECRRIGVLTGAIGDPGGAT